LYPLYTPFIIKTKIKKNIFKKWLQLVQILELLYTNTYSLKFVSWSRIQLDTKDTNVQKSQCLQRFKGRAHMIRIFKFKNHRDRSIHYQ